MKTFISKYLRNAQLLQPLDMINDSQWMAAHMFEQHHLRGQRPTRSWMT